MLKKNYFIKNIDKLHKGEVTHLCFFINAEVDERFKRIILSYVKNDNYIKYTYPDFKSFSNALKFNYDSTTDQTKVFILIDSRQVDKFITEFTAWIKEANIEYNKIEIK